jgi:predicted DNA-binding ArsR family transcriptional regulator
MSVVEIRYNDIPTFIQYQSNESLKEIFQRFKNKINAENKELFYLCNGEQITDEDLTIPELTSDKKIIILANDIVGTTIVKSLIKSDYVICPVCKESAILEIKDNIFKIYGCKKEHTTENILINQFNKFQEIDYSEIICQCGQKRNKTFNNQFYFCCECKNNLCPRCKSIHDNKHKIINYNDKWFICILHKKEYSSFCNKCKKNICIMCDNNHRNNHAKSDLINYGDLIIPDNKILNYMKEIRKEIDKFNDDIQGKINKLNKIIENVEEFYKIANDIN